MFWHLYGVQVLVIRSSNPFILVVWVSGLLTEENVVCYMYEKVVGLYLCYPMF